MYKNYGKVRELIDILKRIRPMRKIEVSVYGMRRESYEAITRNAGSYDAAFRGIKLLMENNIPFVVKGVVLPPNKHELDYLERWSQSLPWMNEPFSATIFLDLRARRDSEVKNERIRNLRLPPESCLAFMFRRPFEFLKEMKFFYSKFLLAPTDRLFICRAGCMSCCLDAYGYVQACLPLRHPKTVFNIKEFTLREGLSEFFPRLRKMRATNEVFLARCARCFLRSSCEQCPGRSWRENGTLDTPVEYRCKITHILARFLKLLNKDEHGWEIREWKERVNKFCEASFDEEIITKAGLLKIN